MAKEANLLKTHVELKREYDEDQICYYKLIIGTDPETRVVITDSNLEHLLNDLPNFLSTVIHSQVLIENTPSKEESK